MAEYLASIFDTERDKVNCSFYFKVGACRHIDRCSKMHNKPTFSQTILLKNMYINPQNFAKSADDSHCKSEYGCLHQYGILSSINKILCCFTTPSRFLNKYLLVSSVTDEEIQEHYDNFYEDVFIECEDKYGEIEEMNVCVNLGDHLAGNVYIKFRREEHAEAAVNDLNNRWFGGRPIFAELSPVTDFREACCYQYALGECHRCGFCNFMHLKPISLQLRKFLYGRRLRRHHSSDHVGTRRTRSSSPRHGHHHS
ncbi:hypothetical protein AGLY_015400 [Aphis glycines]|uniref:Splicing factor U2af 38 kDa subunit n=1 Tax=Aphis glycines TaxID=307491 RepID=A0A6G0T362_APHGL|nr:hypothetical protein AGLY_015400 [Aphis glycines]